MKLISNWAWTQHDSIQIEIKMDQIYLFNPSK